MSVMMEAPIDFEIWGTIVAPSSEAVEVFLRHNPGVVRFEALRVLLQSRTLGEPIALATEVRWADCEAMRLALGAIARELVVYQTGWGLDANATWCPRHEVFHGGCLGCPICASNGRLR